MPQNARHASAQALQEKKGSPAHRLPSPRVMFAAQTFLSDVPQTAHAGTRLAGGGAMNLAGWRPGPSHHSLKHPPRGAWSAISCARRDLNLTPSTNQIDVLAFLPLP